jgi:ferredoxin
MISFAKQDYYRSKPWLRATASLPCVQCGAEGTQAAHRNEGKGMGMKVDDCLVAALCPTCHAEIDQGGVFTRAERREAMDKAILETLVQLARNGLVAPK